MPPSTVISKRLGYGGSAMVDTVQVLITSGSFSTSTAQTYLNMISTPHSGTMAGKVLHADGISSYTGSISFDVTKAAMGMFSTSRMLGRFHPFDVGINDGNNQYDMTNCKLTSLSLTGAAGGLVSSSLSFMAGGAFSGATVTNDFIRDDATKGYLIGYWWTGAHSDLKVKSWTLTMTQDVQAAYGNLNSVEPLYLRVGLVEYSLVVESYTRMSYPNQSNVVRISTDSFTLTGNTNEEGFQYNGVTDLGTYSYTFSTGSTDGTSNMSVLTIT